MGFMVQIEESKVDKMTEYAEKMLKYGGKLMSCIEEMSEESGMGYRRDSMGGRYADRSGSMGYRRDYGRKDDDWEDEDEMMGERRGYRRRDSMGRYR